MKLILKCAGWLLVAAALNAGAASPDPKPAATGDAGSNLTVESILGDKVVAKGNGFEIRRSQLDQAVVNSRANATARGQDIPANELPILELRSLQYLIQIQLLNNIATADDKAKGQAESDKAYDNLKKQSVSEDVMIRKFKAAGMTPESFRKGLAEEETARIVLASKVNVTSADLKKFYDDNPDKFERPEQARLQFIIMGASDPGGSPLTEGQKAEKKKSLADIRDRALKGEDFAKLARDYSENPSAKQAGNETVIARGLPQLPVTLENAAFSLKTNQVSDIIPTEAGFYLLKLLEKLPAGKVTLEEASPDIRNYLEGIAIRKILPATEAQLRKDANVEIVDTKLKTLEDNLPPPGLAPDDSGKPPTGTN
jgi:parvulin-like peptidyl-prolyl isomerase